MVILLKSVLYLCTKYPGDAEGSMWVLLSLAMTLPPGLLGGPIKRGCVSSCPRKPLPEGMQPGSQLFCKTSSLCFSATQGNTPTTSNFSLGRRLPGCLVDSAEISQTEPLPERGGGLETPAAVSPRLILSRSSATTPWQGFSPSTFFTWSF